MTEKIMWERLHYAMIDPADELSKAVACDFEFERLTTLLGKTFDKHSVTVRSRHGDKSILLKFMNLSLTECDQLVEKAGELKRIFADLVCISTQSKTAYCFYDYEKEDLRYGECEYSISVTQSGVRVLNVHNIGIEHYFDKKHIFADASYKDGHPYFSTRLLANHHAVSFAPTVEEAINMIVMRAGTNHSMIIIKKLLEKGT